MAFRRDDPLISSVNHVVQLTGRTDLRNLEASGELDLEDLLRSASNTIHDKLEAMGFSPPLIVNEQVYENAVAWQFLGVLAEAGSLGSEEAEALFARSDHYFEIVRPELAAGVPPVAADGVPSVLNVTEPPFRSALGGER